MDAVYSVRQPTHDNDATVISRILENSISLCAPTSLAQIAATMISLSSDSFDYILVSASQFDSLKRRHISVETSNSTSNEAVAVIQEYL
ncbi:hypothetical protein HK100_001467, partial [Physocladia obscura]